VRLRHHQPLLPSPFFPSSLSLLPFFPFTSPLPLSPLLPPLPPLPSPPLSLPPVISRESHMQQHRAQPSHRHKAQTSTTAHRCGPYPGTVTGDHTRSRQVHMGGREDDGRDCDSAKDYCEHPRTCFPPLLQGDVLSQSIPDVCAYTMNTVR
jgi:hypothetical protein